MHDLINIYRKMTIMEKLGFWGSVASITGLLLFFLPQDGNTKDEETLPEIKQQTTGNNSPTIINRDGQVIINNPKEPEPQPKLNKVFEEGIIGGDIKYLESIIGFARKKSNENGEKRSYKVDNCDVTVGVEQDGTINALTLFLSPICNFSWKDMLPNHSDLPQPNKMHFGDVMESIPSDYWRITASCLSQCGNTENPYIELKFGGSNADNHICAILGSTSDVESWSNLSQKIIKEKGAEFVINFEYNCNYDLKKAAKGILDTSKVDYITIRVENQTDIDEISCERIFK
ncbi:MAG: hypothetical protein CTY29_07300 [Methylobacter sp.]|nr:MAG: hypothetical protein CTY29_07300 [Methylobacter sp.]